MSTVLCLGRVTALAVQVFSTTNPLPGSLFQGADGDQLDAPGLIDWRGLQADGRVLHVEDPNANDNVFGGGDKEDHPDEWTFTTHKDGASPADANIFDSYISLERAANGDLFLYLAFTREKNTGTVFGTFELNQDARLWTNSVGTRIPCRITGDILITYEPRGSSETVLVERWVNDTSAPNGCARTGHVVPAGSLEANGDVQASFNTAGAILNFLPGMWGNSIPVLNFGESAINLTHVLATNFHDRCGAFDSVWMHSRSSLPETAALKDLVSPTEVQVRSCKATPGLTSTASGVRRHARRPRVELGAPLSDVAHLSGGASPTGSLTFRLYGPGDADCSGPPVFTWTAAVDGNGYYSSGFFTPTTAGVYRWVVEYSGDRDNEAAGPTACGDDNETVAVSRAQPSLTTSASGTVHARSHRRHRLRRLRLAGQTLFDRATLAGGASPTGTIHFRLYGPGDADCSGPPAFSYEVTVNGNGVYTSGVFTPSEAGVYRWVANYSGDHNNAPPGPTACGEDAETVVVRRATPSLATIASPSVTLGGSVFDQALLTGAANPDGTIEFRLYGPGDSGCSGPPVFSSTVNVSGDGPFVSGHFTPAHVGTYRWVASYSGDRNNEPAGPTACNDAAEHVVVAEGQRTQPSIGTTAAGGQAGSPIHDTAHLSGGDAPSGQVRFALYGPDDASCSGAPAFAASVGVSGNGDHVSPSFVPMTAGTYRWVVSYSGDARNEPAATACGDPAETVSVSRTTPTFSTHATDTIALGDVIADTAHISGATLPTGTIMFRLYGPSDTGCSGPPVFTATVVVTQNGGYRSPSFPPTAAGTYSWVADYSGDANNEPASSPCGASDESTTVTRARPSLSTSALGVAGRSIRRRLVRAAGTSIHDTAFLSGGFAPTGEIVFRLYGPDDSSCSGPPIFTSATVVNGGGTYNSESFTPTASGSYTWVATYSGDSNNYGAGPTACDAVSETVKVTLPATPTLTSTASPAVTLGGTIHDTAHLANGSSPTGTLNFRAYGPDDPDCSGVPAFSSVVHVTGNGDYDSDPFTPARAGAYRWRVSYSGDAGNHGAGPTPCAEPSELGLVVPPDIIPAHTSLTTTASAPAGIGAPISDTAHLSGGVDPSGSITFELFGPDDAACAGPPAFTSSVAVAGNGDFVSGAFVPSRPGEYRWVASYSGDAENTAGPPTRCGDPAETVFVSDTPGATPSPGPNAKPASSTKPRRTVRRRHRRVPPRFTG